jgi:hypothetical protein
MGFSVGTQAGEDGRSFGRRLIGSPGDKFRKYDDGAYLFGLDWLTVDGITSVVGANLQAATGFRS